MSVGPIWAAKKEGGVYPTADLWLPAWVEDEVVQAGKVFERIEDRMAFVIHLAERNIEANGGPFGAGVFEIESGRLVAPGVNMVVPLNCSLAHAEAMAILIAQRVCGSYDLGASHLPPMELVSSAQPCIQCYGILWWSGLRRLVVGARKTDVEAITGFAEGPLPNDWAEHLEHRSPLEPITVITDILREDARRVLQRYRDAGGPVYNPSS